METEIQELFDSIRVIRETETNALVQNVNNPDQGVLIINEIEPDVDDFKQMIKDVSPEALSLLPRFRFKELKQAVDPIINKLKEIQDKQKNPKEADLAQKQQYINFFRTTADYFQTSKPILWQIIIESLTLKNQDALNETDLNKKLESISAIEESAKGV